jgi:hypothetical protein
VTSVLDGARQWVDAGARTPQLFGPEVVVPEDAPVLDRLVAFLGRDLLGAYARVSTTFSAPVSPARLNTS